MTDPVTFLADILAQRQRTQQQRGNPQSRNPSTSPGPSTGEDSEDRTFAPPSGEALRNGTPATAGQHKRAADADLAKDVQRAAQRLKLSADGEQCVVEFTQASAKKQNMLIMANLVHLQERISAINPVESAWELTKLDVLYQKIETLVVQVILCPKLAGYYGPTPSNIIVHILKTRPGWGFTQQIQNSERKVNVVMTRISKRLTDRRSKIKGAVIASRGLPNETGKSKKAPEKPRHIVDLVTSAIRSVRTSSTSDIKVTVEMCARFALLRKIHAEAIDNGDGYWPAVDDYLQYVRTSLKGQPPDVVSAFLKTILDEDLDRYGQVDLDAMRGVRLSEDLLHLQDIVLQAPPPVNTPGDTPSHTSAPASAADISDEEPENESAE